MFPVIVEEESEQSGFGFSSNPFPLFTNGDMNIVYVYIDENVLETISFMEKTLEGFSINGWYIVDQESLDTSNTTIKLTSKVNNFKEINSLQITAVIIHYSNLNDEIRETTKVNSSEFYDLIKSISVHTDNRIVTEENINF